MTSTSVFQHFPNQRLLHAVDVLLSNMACLVRTGVLRQSLLAAPSKRLLSSSAASLRTSRPLLSGISKPLPLQRTTVIPRITSFHTTARQDIMPPGPQVIQGGVNEPAPVPPPSATHGSYHWTFERLISVGLIPLTIAPFAAGSLNPTLDALFVATILVHSHIGFQCVDLQGNYTFTNVWLQVLHN